MKLSARNQIAGTIKPVKPGATTSQLSLEISPSVTVTAAITNAAAGELGLKPGMAALAVIKAFDVMVGVRSVRGMGGGRQLWLAQRGQQ